jgi:pSer/pThr/pTyr-binding forkhead associated (FHA) protein
LIIATLPPANDDGSMQLTIGRSPDCDLVVHDLTVSKHHAHITWNGAEAVLAELGSVNGTYVNGVRMKARWPLRDGDTLAFGDSHFVFLLAPTLHLRLKRFTR